MMTEFYLHFACHPTPCRACRFSSRSSRAEEWRLSVLTHRRHKSYHPYLEKNKQRVREDEARAAAEELQREQKRVDAVGPDHHESLGWGVADAA